MGSTARKRDPILTALDALFKPALQGENSNYRVVSTAYDGRGNAFLTTWPAFCLLQSVSPSLATNRLLSLHTTRSGVLTRLTVALMQPLMATVCLPEQLPTLATREFPRCRLIYGLTPTVVIHGVLLLRMRTEKFDVISWMPSVVPTRFKSCPCEQCVRHHHLEL